MARSRRTNSRTIQKAQHRAVAIKACDPGFDLGNGVSLSAIQEKITEFQELLNAYNGKLAEIDGLYNDLLAKEKELDSLNTRVLAGIGVKFGKDSSEYEQAGGTRTSEIKRKPRTRKTAETGR